MTVQPKIKKLLTHASEVSSDLVVVGNTLVFKPVIHLFRGIMLDRSSDANRFRPRWAIAPLFLKWDDFPVGLGQLIKSSSSWLFSDPGAASRLAEAIERDVLPLFRSIDSLDVHANIVIPKNRDDLNYDWRFHFFYSIAIGDLKTAQALLLENDAEIIIGVLNGYEDGLAERLAAEGDELSLADRESLALLLHEREANSVDKLNLRHLWQSRPFPLEQ